jgi:DNA-binding transcriptional LysR family regulator
MNPNFPSWDLVLTFLTVMREGSLSSAARTMRVSQPTIRRQIENLEAELRAPLFSRSPTGLMATDVATALLPQAEAAEAAINAFRRTAANPALGETGPVRVTCSDIFGVEIIPGLLAPLLKTYPGLVIELVTSNQTDDLVRREADVAVRLTSPKQLSLIAKKVRPIELGLFANSAFLKSFPPPKDVEELSSKARFIGDDRRDVIRKGFLAAEIAPPQNLIFRSDNDLAQLAAIRQGIGIGICHVRLAKQGGLVRVLPKVSARLDCWVVMHEDLKQMKRVRLVFDHLVKVLQKHPD